MNWTLKKIVFEKEMSVEKKYGFEEIVTKKIYPIVFSLIFHLGN